MTEKMKVGLIGTGFMGKTHSFGYSIAMRAFDLPIAFKMALLAGLSLERTQSIRRMFGFTGATDDWHDIINDPSIQIVNITTPNYLHKEIALAAIAKGKHVHCEKPLAPTAADALEMAEAAEAAGVKTQVGFNYLVNPLFTLARDMIAAGELGEIYSYRGIHAEDFMADINTPWTERLDADAAGGALADIGSHALATAEFLLGPIARVLGDCKTIVKKRPDPSGAMRTVEVDDVSHAFIEFASGATGSIEANWIAHGRKMQHDFEIYGSRGALHFSQQRLNELHFFSAADGFGRKGFRRIEMGTDHPPYDEFCPASGHQLGFNELKAIEIKGFADAIAGKIKEPYNFRAGYRIQSLVDTIQRSSAEKSWIETP